MGEDGTRGKDWLIVLIGQGKTVWRKDSQILI